MRLVRVPECPCAAAQSRCFLTTTTMRFTAALLLSVFATASAYDVISLTPDNYDEMTAGKTGTWRSSESFLRILRSPSRSAPFLYSLHQVLRPMGT